MRRSRATVPLAKKLCAIRLWKDLTQGEILKIVYPETDENYRAYVSQWENATREPRREILVRYARLADIELERLLRDDLDLPPPITDGTDRYDGDIRRKRGASAGLPAAKVESVAAKNTNETNVAVTHQNEKTIEANAPHGERIASTTKHFNGAGVIDMNDAACSCNSKEEPPVEEKPAAKVIEYRDEFTRLPLVIGDDPTEPITFDLPIETLDELHDLHLELLRGLPRPLRSLLTVEGIIDFCVNIILVNHENCREQSLIFKKVQLIADDAE